MFPTEFLAVVGRTSGDAQAETKQSSDKLQHVTCQEHGIRDRAGNGSSTAPGEDEADKTPEDVRSTGFCFSESKGCCILRQPFSAWLQLEDEAERTSSKPVILGAKDSQQYAPRSPCELQTQKGGVDRSAFLGTSDSGLPRRLRGTDQEGSLKRETESTTMPIGALDVFCGAGGGRAWDRAVSEIRHSQESILWEKEDPSRKAGW
jgi:hypothetical protein